jgi:hypothetical protein
MNDETRSYFSRRFLVFHHERVRCVAVVERDVHCY